MLIGTGNRKSLHRGKQNIVAETKCFRQRCPKCHNGSSKWWNLFCSVVENLPKTKTHWSILKARTKVDEIADKQSTTYLRNHDSKQIWPNLQLSPNQTYSHQYILHLQWHWPGHHWLHVSMWVVHRQYLIQLQKQVTTTKHSVVWIF